MATNCRWRDPEISWKGGRYVIGPALHEDLIAWIERGRDAYSDYLDAVLSNDLRGCGLVGLGLLPEKEAVRDDPLARAQAAGLAAVEKAMEPEAPR